MTNKDFYIADQDREYIYPININSLHPAIPMSGDGTNCVYLTMEAPDQYMKPKTVILGCFDSLKDIVREISAICNFKGEPGDVYRISGYSNGGFAAW